MLSYIKDLIYGIFIGASVMIPGLSGGTTAVIFGIYAKIMETVGNIFSRKNKNLLFLFTLGAGALIGFYITSFPISYILNKYPLEFSYAVIGVLAGSVPIFLKDIKSNIIRNLFFVLTGFLFTVFFDRVPAFDLGGLTFIFISVLLAAALILPGISLTNILIAFGYYERVISAVKELDVIFLLKFFGLVILSVIALAKVLDKWYKKYPVSINMMILGMILASAVQVFPGVPDLQQFPACLMLFLFGIFISLALFFYEKRTN